MSAYSYCLRCACVASSVISFVTNLYRRSSAKSAFMFLLHCLIAVCSECLTLTRVVYLYDSLFFCYLFCLRSPLIGLPLFFPGYGFCVGCNPTFCYVWSFLLHSFSFVFEGTRRTDKIYRSLPYQIILLKTITGSLNWCPFPCQMIISVNVNMHQKVVIIISVKISFFVNRTNSHYDSVQ